MSSTMEKSEIIRHFMGRVHCSQVVVKAWAEELGLDEETAMRMAGPFGGGCMHGEVCGCVTGALMLIGAEYGHYEIGDEEGNQRMVEMVQEFHTRFQEEAGSLSCRELTGFDFSKEGQMDAAFASGVVFDVCPKLVNIALSILDDMLG